MLDRQFHHAVLAQLDSCNGVHIDPRHYVRLGVKDKSGFHVKCRMDAKFFLALCEHASLSFLYARLQCGLEELKAINLTGK